MIGLSDNEIINKGFLISRDDKSLDIIRNGISCRDYYSSYYENQWNSIYLENMRNMMMELLER